MDTYQQFDMDHVSHPSTVTFFLKLSYLSLQTLSIFFRIKSIYIFFAAQGVHAQLQTQKRN